MQFSAVTSSMTSNASSSSYTSRTRSIRLADMPSMRASSSTKIGVNLLSNTPDESTKSINTSDISYSDLSVPLYQQRNVQISQVGSDLSQDKQPRVSIPLIYPLERELESDFSQNIQPNISIPLICPPRREVREKSLVDKLKDVVDGCCVQIDRQIQIMLNSTETDVIRLLLNDKFKNYFVQKATNSLTEPLNRWVRNQILEDQLWDSDSTAATTDVNETQMPFDSTFGNSRHTDLEQTITNSISETALSMNDPVQFQKLSPEPEWTPESFNLVINGDQQNTVVNPRKTKAASAAAELKERCKITQKHSAKDRHISTSKRIEMSPNTNCRVLIERLTVPINGCHNQSVLQKDDAHQITINRHQSGGSAHSSTIVSDNTHMEIACKQTLPNGKRKIENANVSVSLEKKTRDAVDIRRQRALRRMRNLRRPCNLLSMAGKRIK